MGALLDLAAGTLQTDFIACPRDVAQPLAKLSVLVIAKPCFWSLEVLDLQKETHQPEPYADVLNCPNMDKVNPLKLYTDSSHPEPKCAAGKLALATAFPRGLVCCVSLT